MDRPVIIHLRSAEFFGGPERAILGQCRAMSDFKFVCASFVRGSEPNRFLLEANKQGLEIAVIGDAFVGDFRVIGKIKALIADKKADLIVCHDYKANFFGRFAAKKIGIRQIAYFRGYTTEDRKVRFYNYINSVLLRKIPLVLTVSEKSALLLQALGVDSVKIRVVPNAIENEKLIGDDFRRSMDRDRPLRAVCAGRLSFEKGYDVLLKAIAKIKDANPHFAVEIYGHGPEKKTLKNMAYDLGLTEIVSFRGFVDDILPILRKSDFLILPSRSEGMPNILLEAWSQKLGVVATSVGGVPEMIQDGISGFLAAPDDPGILGDKLSFAVKYPDKMIEFGETGYELVKSRYNYRRQADLLRPIYTGTVGR